MNMTSIQEVSTQFSTYLLIYNATEKHRKHGMNFSVFFRVFPWQNLPNFNLISRYAYTSLIISLSFMII